MWGRGGGRGWAKDIRRHMETCHFTSDSFKSSFVFIAINNLFLYQISPEFVILHLFVALLFIWRLFSWLLKDCF